MNNYGRYNNNNAGGGGGGGGDGSFLADADTLDVLGQLSTEVGAGFSKPQLAAAMHLLRLGVNPSALVAITQELRRMTHNTPPVIQPPVHNTMATLTAPAAVIRRTDIRDFLWTANLLNI
ncbi:hypothetical protein BX661DRAFT_173153 [Kickxella alabastrina]|uniref:uncharacterized protein n=1 Tax=Kickxella alabastrina TaxID=61397 RepID=UPI0022204EEA|nr:uncharacterized protein BX661DRAFT_173153 [Kickxella alabastrina]KAI7822096.1 hypothetical protein BX661DRAFT_173153 [Kickxella alabastrina]